MIRTGNHTLFPEIARGDCVVVIPVFEAASLFKQCLLSVLANTDESVPILVADDASPLSDIESICRNSPDFGRRLAYIKRSTNVGYTKNVNLAIRETYPADVVLVNSDVRVARNWLDGLQRAAYSSSNIATASALTNHGSILSTPSRNLPDASLAQRLNVDEVASQLKALPTPTACDIPVAVGHCTFYRRDALELVGHFDETIGVAYAEEVDYSLRAQRYGLRHVAAGDVFVAHFGSGSFGTSGRAVQRTADRTVSARYPYYEPMVSHVAAGETSRLSSAIRLSATAIRGLTLTIDLTCLDSNFTGTQVYGLELARALHKLLERPPRVVVRENIASEYTSLFNKMGLETLSVSQLHENCDIEPTDIAHRPFQVWQRSELELLRRLGRRIVVTHQDAIAYDTPTLFPSYRSWKAFRDATRESLTTVDRVIFFTETALVDATREIEVSPLRTSVVNIGPSSGRYPTQLLPGSKAAQFLKDEAYLVMVGTDFVHKNRVFALQVLAELKTTFNWPGHLVLIGPHQEFGTSAGDEAGFLIANPRLKPFVHDMGQVSEEIKNAIVGNSRGILYPTTYEGFGMVPFDAVHSGVPCFFAHVTSLAEIFPEECATIVAWNASETAEAVFPFLLDGTARDQLIRLQEEASSKFSWDRTARETVDAYLKTLAMPINVLSAVRDNRYDELRSQLFRTNKQLADRENELRDLQITYEAASEQLDACIIRHGYGLAEERNQRALLAVASRPILRNIVLTPMYFAYRCGRKVKALFRSNN